MAIKKIVALITILALLMLSGCIFVRLSRIIVQMKFPKENMEFTFENGSLHGKLLHPVALLSDAETILGQKATKLADRHYKFQFDKQVKQDRNPWQVELWTNKRGQISAFQFPPKLGQIFGQEVLLNAISAIGYAEVSMRKKTIYLKMSDRINKDQVFLLMGQPASEKDGLWSYQFLNGKSPFCIDFLFADELKSVMISANGFYLDLKFNVESAK